MAPYKALRRNGAGYAQIGPTDQMVGDAGAMTVTPTGGVSTTIPNAFRDRFDKTAGNTTPRTGLFWTTWDPTAASLPAPTGRVGLAKIQKMQDRVQIGLAALNDGGFPAVNKCPLEAFEAQRSDPRGFRTSWSQLAVGAENGGIAVLGYAFASSISDPAFAGIQLGMGGCFTSVNDSTTVQQLMTGLYAVAFRRPGAGVMQGTGTCGAEIDICNEGNTLSLSPANPYPAGGFTTALQLNSGALSPLATDASCALSMGYNGAKFALGWLVAYNAIAGVTIDATSQRAIGGYGSAARFGVFQGLEWWNNDGSSWTSRIVSRQLTPANTQEIAFQDDSIVMGGDALKGRSFQALYAGPNTGAWMQVSPAVGSAPMTITAGGQTNADVAVRSVGSGMLVLDRAANTATAATAGTNGAAPSQVAGYLKVKIGDGGGTVVKVPYYAN